jgi:hypothetical protein
VNPLVEGSSPSRPTTSHRNHRVMALRPGDQNPLVWGVAGVHESTDVAGVVLGGLIIYSNQWLKRPLTADLNGPISGCTSGTQNWPEIVISG